MDLPLFFTNELYNHFIYYFLPNHVVYVLLLIYGAVVRCVCSQVSLRTVSSDSFYIMLFIVDQLVKKETPTNANMLLNCEYEI